jgi:uncharacterized MAPEG superfamily protein
MQANTLSTELFWLTMSILLTAFMWVPYIINRLKERGFGIAIYDPQGGTDTNIAWADRMMRAHSNAIENLALFAPLVLMIQVTGLNSEWTALTCMVYFYSRMAHYLIFSFGIPYIRVPAFAINFGCSIVLAMVLLGFL